MAAFVIINGVIDPEIHGRVEQYAFSEGIAACDLRSYLLTGLSEDETPIFFYVDPDGMRCLHEQLINILFMRCPMILVPTSAAECESLRRDPKYPCDIAEYPFRRAEFQQFLEEFVDPRLWETRTMVYGALSIDRAGREVYVNGSPLSLTGYDYDIFLLLIEHLGDAVSRELINRVLPPRKRGSLRNVDTHIKRIRKLLGNSDLIQSIRSVGYCIPAAGQCWDRFAAAPARPLPEA